MTGTGPALFFFPFLTRSSSLFVLLLIPALIRLWVFAVQRLRPRGWLGAVVLRTGVGVSLLGDDCRRTWRIPLVADGTCLSASAPAKQKPIYVPVCVQMYACLQTRAHALKMYAEKEINGCFDINDI